MNAEQAKKSADAIILAFATIGTDWRNASRATEEIVKILTAGDAALEREYRAGTWVPKGNQSYWCVHSDGQANVSRWGNDSTDQDRINYGNVYPTKAIAEAAKAHADWWREFDMSDEGGEFEISYNSQQNCLRPCLTSGYEKYGDPRYRTSENVLVVIKRLGGEQKVIEMLNAGRVFRFKWGGQ